jgi:hypothetical protein
MHSAVFRRSSGVAAADDVELPNCGGTLSCADQLLRSVIFSERAAELPQRNPTQMPVQYVPIWTPPRLVAAFFRGTQRFVRRAMFGPTIVPEGDRYR